MHRFFAWLMAFVVVFGGNTQFIVGLPNANELRRSSAICPLRFAVCTVKS